MPAKPYYYKNREKCIALSRAWEARNKDRVAASRKARRLKNLTKVRAYYRIKSKEWRTNNAEKVKEQKRKFQVRHIDRLRAERKTRNRNFKLDVIKRYGGKCACCGESTIEFLSIDHIDGKGAAHRRMLYPNAKRPGSGSGFYPWLKRNNWPTGFQVLCYNCNCAKGFFGQCPHQTQKMAAD